MKLKHWFITLFIFFTCHTVVSANTTLDNLTQDDGITALKAGDELGFEVLSRAELENVRGEAMPLALYYAVISAPSLATAIQYAIAYHFPAILVRQLWNETH